jgi:tripartite-type tricarboxylate transporter receptor subunit TctC
MKKCWLRIGGIVLVAAFLGCSGGALAAEWKPTRPVEIVAPAGPGGGWDRQARIIQRIAKEKGLLDKPVLVSNKPGGGGATGWTYLKGKAGRGEYLACTSSLLLLNNILGTSELMYDDFTPIAAMQTEWEVVAVKNDAPWKDLKEFLDALREDPGSIPIGVGPAMGNDDHVQLLMLTAKADIDPAALKFVVYPSTAATMLPALMGDHVKAITTSYGECLEQVKAGNIRFLGVSSPERVASTPEVPTYREQGYDVVFGHWRGIIGAPDMTPEMKAFWGNFFKEVVESDLYKQAMETEGLEPFFLDPDEYFDFLAEQYEVNKDLLHKVGLAK